MKSLKQKLEKIKFLCWEIVYSNKIDEVKSELSRWGQEKLLEDEKFYRIAVFLCAQKSSADLISNLILSQNAINKEEKQEKKEVVFFGEV